MALLAMLMIKTSFAGGFLQDDDDENEYHEHSYLSSDFISGFETGILTRDDEYAFQEYACDRPKPNPLYTQQILPLVTPMKLAAGMMADPAMNKIVDTLETFITSFSTLYAVFAGDYEGGEFCEGLIFGKGGAKMLTELALSFRRLPPDHDPSLRE